MKTNEILHGDCLDLLPEIPDKSIDMILCEGSEVEPETVYVS